MGDWGEGAAVEPDVNRPTQSSCGRNANKNLCMHACVECDKYVYKIQKDIGYGNLTTHHGKEGGLGERVELGDQHPECSAQ